MARTKTAATPASPETRKTARPPAAATASRSNGRVPALTPDAPALTPDAPAIRRTADLLKHAADPTRLGVLILLAAGEMNVTELCAALGNMSQPSVSHHLAILRNSRLIQPRRSGKSIIYSLTSQGRALADAAAGLMEDGR